MLYLRQSGSRRKGRHNAGDINPEAIHFEVSCGTAAWRDLWTGYFDLDRNYAALRASIPASDDCLCRAAAYGAGLRSFPTAERLASVSAEELKACGLGYRVPYVMDAARKVSDGTLDLKALNSASGEELLASLKQVSGVGTKVAGCIGLFAYGRTGLAPVDVWIGRVIDCVYGGCDPFAAYGDAAGIMQQYIFHYALAHKKEFSGR